MLIIDTRVFSYTPVQPSSQPLTYQLHASSNEHTNMFWTWRICNFSRGVCSRGFRPHTSLDRIPEADLASEIPREVGIGNINAKMAGICYLKTAGRKLYSCRRSCAPHVELLCLKFTSQRSISCSGSAHRHTKPHWTVSFISRTLNPNPTLISTTLLSAIQPLHQQHDESPRL